MQAQRAGELAALLWALLAQQLAAHALFAGWCVLAGVGRKAHSLMSSTALHSSISLLSGIRNTLFPSQLSDAACIA